jgi:hypothetical protein
MKILRSIRGSSGVLPPHPWPLSRAGARGIEVSTGFIRGIPPFLGYLWRNV